MKKTTFIKSIFATLLIVSSAFTTKADEGMWLIHLMAQTNYEAMKAKGVELSAEEIYSETTPSLKDAIVALDYGSCTGSMISKNGLMITNHHCAYDDIHITCLAELYRAYADDDLFRVDERYGKGYVHFPD